MTTEEKIIKNKLGLLDVMQSSWGTYQEPESYLVTPEIVFTVSRTSTKKVEKKPSRKSAEKSLM